MPCKVSKYMDQDKVRLVFSDISIEEANQLLQGLQELPAKICNPLSRKLQEQANQQIMQLQQEAANSEQPPEAA